MQQNIQSMDLESDYKDKMEIYFPLIYQREIISGTIFWIAVTQHQVFHRDFPWNFPLKLQLLSKQ